MRISIIVPVLNEAAIVRGFLEHLRQMAPQAEVIVVDGGSNDETVSLCRNLAHHVVGSGRGRGRQMNAGARVATGTVLWFLHADSRIANSSLAMIGHALRDRLVAGGCFQLQIVPPRLVYRIRDAAGNLCVNMFHIALGDRGFFCRREDFHAVGGYPDQLILEDADFYNRLQKLGRVRQLPLKIQTSARRYEALGPVRTSLFYFLIMILYCAHLRMEILEKMVRWFSTRQKPPETQRLDAAPVAHCSQSLRQGLS